jgi:hypothetical protein
LADAAVQNRFIALLKLPFKSSEDYHVSAGAAFGTYGGIFRIELCKAEIAGTHPITMRSGFEQSDEGRITG